MVNADIPLLHTLERGPFRLYCPVLALLLLLLFGSAVKAKESDEELESRLKEIYLTKGELQNS